MAITKNGTYYPDDYNKTADVPEDMKKLAESVDAQVDDIKTDVQSLMSDVRINRQIINLLEVKDQEKEEDIKETKQDIEDLKIEQNSQSLEISQIKETMTDKETEIEKVINIEDAKTFGKLEVLGNYEQNGTPSSQNPIEIKTLGGNARNIFSLDNKIEGVKINRYDNIIEEDEKYSTFYQEVKPGEKYVFSFKSIGTYGQSANITYAQCNEVPEIGAEVYLPNMEIMDNLNGHVFEPSKKYLLFTILGVTLEEGIASIQLEKGETPTNYIPFKQGSTTIKIEGDTQSKNYTLLIQKEMLKGDYFSKEIDGWKEIHNWEKIDSYNDESVTTDFISTTGALTTGATVYYKLTKTVKIKCTPEQSEILNLLDALELYEGKNKIRTIENIALLKLKYVSNHDRVGVLEEKVEQLEQEVESYKNSLPRETQTGEYITMQNTADKVKFKDFVLGGNSKQASRSGKNILDINSPDIYLARTVIETEGNVLHAQTSGDSTAYISIPLNFKANTDYTLSGIAKVVENTVSYSSLYIKIRANKNGGDWITGSSFSIDTSLTENKAIDWTFNSGEYTKGWLWIYLKPSADVGNISMDFTNLQLEEREVATDYEQYGASPSPEFPSQIENVCAKNLVSGKWTNGLLSANGDLSNTDQNLYRHFKKALKAGTYTYSYSVAKGYLTQVRAVNLTTQSNLTVTDKTFTLEEDAEISLGFRKNDSTEWDIGENLEDIRFMLEEGTEETDYIQNGVVVTVANKNIANIDEIYMNMKSYSPGNCTEETVDGRDCIRFANSRFRPDVENPFNLISYKYKEKTAYTFRILAKAGEQPEGVGGSGSLTFQAVYTDGSKISASKTKADATSFVELRFVTDPEKTIARVGFNYGTSCQWYMDKSSIFIAEGDTTDYVANEQQQVVFPLAQGQKLYLGDYPASDGIHHVRKQIELNGTEAWELRYTTENYCTFSTNLETPYLLSKDVKALCTHYKFFGTVETVSSMINTYDDIGFALYNKSGSSANTPLYINSTQTTLEGFKAFLAQQKTAGTPVILEYDLAEEEVEPYTEEQQEAYNKPKELTTYATQTNIYSTNNIKPVFTVTGIKDVNSLITQVNQLILENGGN